MVTANVAPRLCAEFQAATLAGDYKKALAYQDLLFPLHEAIFLEPGLAGANYGLSLLGKCSEDVRLPLVTLTDGTKARLKAELADPLQLGAPIPGIVTSLAVSVGTKVAKGDKLLTMEAMKMQNTVYAPCDGVVAELHIALGDTVESKDLLIKIRPAG